MCSDRTKDLLRRDVEHFFHPISVVGQAPRVIWERGKASQLWDTTGKQYTDMCSGGVHCCNLGHGRNELNDAACEQMQKLSFIFSASPSTNTQAIEYAEELAQVLPGDLNHVYFANTGTQSNEVAIQIVRFYWQLHDQPDKYKIICLNRSWHGSSPLTASFRGGMPSFGREYPGIVRIPNYHCHQCPFDLSYPSCGIQCAKWLEKVIDQEGEQFIACMIAEPVLGAGGVIWPPDEYWPIVRDICTRRNVLLIDDEVMAGFCRSGKMFTIQHWNIVPDLMTMGKGINSNYLPLAAVGVSDRIHKDLEGKRFPGVSTSDANPACVATARAALKIYVDEDLADRTAKLGIHLHERLVKEFLPLQCVDDVLGKGLFQSFEIALNKTTGSDYNLKAAEEARETIYYQCMERGVFSSRYDGYPSRQPVCPSCIISEDELDSAVDIMLSVIKEIKPV
ncbi:aspartate aminotransferase family protein [Chloroflexota bacterium]